MVATFSLHLDSQYLISLAFMHSFPLFYVYECGVSFYHTAGVPQFLKILERPSIGEKSQDLESP